MAWFIGILVVVGVGSAALEIWLVRQGREAARMRKEGFSDLDNRVYKHLRKRNPAGYSWTPEDDRDAWLSFLRTPVK